MKVSSLWIGNRLSRVETLSIASALGVGHEYTLYSYEKIDNLPGGALLADANEILARDKVYQYGDAARAGKGSYAGFSNWFRYEMLRVVGGVWVDTDLIFIRPLPEFTDYLFGREDANLIGTAVLGVRSDPAKLPKKLAAACANPLRLNEWDTTRTKINKLKARFRARAEMGNVPWGTTGPKALTSAVRALGLEDRAKPTEHYYSVPHQQWRICTEPGSWEAALNNPEVCTVHLWNEFMRRTNFDKEGPFLSGSLLAESERRYRNYLK